MSIVTPKSHCPHCKYSIPWYLNIPLVTWLVLHGRCKNCGAPISLRYFMVELLTGTAFLSCWLAFGDAGHPLPSMPVALVYAVFLAGLIVATFIDFEHFIIPDEITLGGMAVGFVASFFLPSLQDATALNVGMRRSFIGAIVGAATIYAILRLGKWLFGRQRVKLPMEAKIVFAETSVHLPDKEIPYEELFYRKSDVIVLRAHTVELVDRGYKDVLVRLSPSALEIGEEKMNPDDVPCMEAVSAEIVLPREAMGLGDVKFMGAIGAFLGWQGVMFSLMLSSMIGAVVGVTLIAMRRRDGHRACLTGLTSRWRRRSGFSAERNSSGTLRHVNDFVARRMVGQRHGSIPPELQINAAAIGFYTAGLVFREEEARRLRPCRFEECKPGRLWRGRTRALQNHHQ